MTRTLLTVQYAPTFIRMYKRLPPLLQTEVKEKIEQFRSPSQHSSLRVHKLKNLKNTYSFSINYQTRVVFQYETKTVASLLYIGSHDEVY